MTTWFKVVFFFYQTVLKYFLLQINSLFTCRSKIYFSKSDNYFKFNQISKEPFSRCDNAFVKTFWKIALMVHTYYLYVVYRDVCTHDYIHYYIYYMYVYRYIWYYIHRYMYICYANCRKCKSNSNLNTFLSFPLSLSLSLSLPSFLSLSLPSLEAS